MKQHGSLLIGCAAIIALGACSGGDPGGPGQTSGGATTLGSGGATPVMSGGSGGSSGANSGGMTSTGSGGTSNVSHGGASASGGASAGASSKGGASGATGTGAGGASAGGANSGGGSSGSGNSGASNSGGSTSGSGGSTSAGGCTRDLLKSTVDTYFKALAAHDAAMLPVASSVKFTENGKAMALGSGGLWMTAGALKYSQSALDTMACATASEAVVPDGTMDIPVAVRLKLVDQKITEIETIAVRPGDYKVSGSNFASNTAAIISADTTVKWETPVPDDKRNTYAELTGWIDKYYRMFPAGVCNTTSDCKRLENGGGNFSCSAGASCSTAQPGSKADVMTPHVLIADVETGIGVGFAMFQGADTDMHMFKMYGGQVYAVHAVLGAAGSSGWD